MGCDPPERPDVRDLVACELPGDALVDEIDLSGALVEHGGRSVTCSGRIRLEESELRGCKLDAPSVPGLSMRDVVLRDCDLSNVCAREGSLRRVELHTSRLVGFALQEGRAQDLWVVDATLMLASFARAGLQRVLFERVNLRDASFMQTRMESVAFVGCDLAGADFRGARAQNCALRESPLDDVVGVESLRGFAMPWPDVIGSAGAFAAALGIAIEAE